MTTTESSSHLDTEVVLIGAGIMSATLGMLLKELKPSVKITILERLEDIAGESTDAWNNAGTGHSAFCELNYTPQCKDKSIDISKALKIASNFEESKQFWAYLIKEQKIAAPKNFIQPIPHMSFVWGKDNVDFLKKRQELLVQNELFAGMVYSDDWDQLSEWMPLIMAGRDKSQKVAATYIERGTDINFGALARILFKELKSLGGVNILFKQEVKKLKKDLDGNWIITVKDLESGEKNTLKTPFVFIGAGGGSQLLLEKSQITESHGYGGFPISGQWLNCTNEALIVQHQAKVYGKASVGAPPMSVPHLDTRIINGKKALLFGPYAGFSTKFLKKGSYMDWFRSINLKNIMPMIHAGLQNIPLTQYLIKEVLQSQEKRMESLREYFPEARSEDWQLFIAGQRVQVIKKDEKLGGKLEFGTEVVCAADGSLAALLGASPGASIAVPVMIDLLKRCFKSEFQSEAWQNKLKLMIPSYGKSLMDDPALCHTIRVNSDTILEIQKS